MSLRAVAAGATVWSMNVPSLLTERLTLRAHRLEDFPALASMWAEPEVFRFIGGKASTEQESWTRLLKFSGHWALQGFGYWAVEEKAGGRYVGDVGFADHKRDMTPSIAGLPELGWVLSPAVHGRGYATEAVRAALAWGDVQGWPRVVCIISPENLASIRVAEKCGFGETTPAVHGGKPTLLLTRMTKHED
jgi:RimJ/RimL family protein N-acetyltransferase